MCASLRPSMASDIFRRPLYRPSSDVSGDILVNLYRDLSSEEFHSV